MKVTKTEVEVLKILFVYRGLRAKDVAAFRMNKEEVSTPFEKSNYNILKRLQSKGLVTKYKSAECDHAIYYLTHNAFEYIKYKLEVDFGADGNGLLPVKEDTVFWDLSYEMYSPPKQQLRHFLAGIDCIKKLLPVSNKLRFQTAYYANLKYEMNNKQHKVKPDLSLWVNDKLYAIEVDLCTESKKQLIAKFERYKQYYDYCMKNDAAQRVCSILFVVPNLSESNLNRRWITVLEAFYTAFNNELDVDINFVLLPISEFGKTVNFEMHRDILERTVLENIKRDLSVKGYNKSFIYRATVNARSVIVYLNDTNLTFKPSFSFFNNERETKYFSDKYLLYEALEYLKQLPMKFDSQYGYQFNDCVLRCYAPYKPPKIPKNIEKSGLNKTLLEKLLVYESLSNKYSILRKND